MKSNKEVKEMFNINPSMMIDLNSINSTLFRTLEREVKKVKRDEILIGELIGVLSLLPVNNVMELIKYK